MPRFAADLSRQFLEWDLEDRFVAAGQAGFKGVELPFPYIMDQGKLGDLLSMNGLELACFNAPVPGWDDGNRGLAARPGWEDEFFDTLYEAFEMADFLEAKRIRILAGLIQEDEDFDVVYDTFVGNLMRAAKEARQEGLTLLLEPVSALEYTDYLLETPDQALAVIGDVQDRGLKLSLNVFHAQHTQGRLTETVERGFTELGHVRIAGVPDQAEPDTGEVSYPYIFDMLDSHGYDGWIGLDYTPRMGTLAGLRWANPWGISKDGVTVPTKTQKK